MNITGLQVIKRNPTTVFGAEVGEKVQLNIGDTLRVHVGFNYRGREQNVTLYSAIGSRSFLLGFDEYSVGKAALRLPESPDDFTPVEGSVDIEVGAISAGTDYDLYCKIEEFPEAGMPQVDDVIEILEAFADRATIEQAFHDVKVVCGSSQQQVRNIWTNVSVYHLNLWIHTLVELWAWKKPKRQICDRSASPWDDSARRPSHADRRKALCRKVIEEQLLAISRGWWLPRIILALVKQLTRIAI